jgi:hypothetical protein
MIYKKTKKKKGEFNQSFDEPKYCFDVFNDKFSSWWFWVQLERG